MSFYIICFKMISNIPEKTKIIRNFITISLSIYMLYEIYTIKYNHCSFHYDCFGDEKNELNYNTIVYETYNECLTSYSFSELIIDYYEQNVDEKQECYNTEYGCCKIKNICQTLYEYNFTYEKYLNTFKIKNETIGEISTYIAKKDHDGTNCLTYNDYIQFKEYNEIIDVLKNYFIFVIITLIIYIFIIFTNQCIKKKNIKNDEEYDRLHPTLIV